MGNIVVGFDKYARNGHSRAQQPRKPAMDSDRIFSLSSVTAKNYTPLRDTGKDLAIFDDE